MDEFSRRQLIGKGWLFGGGLLAAGNALAEACRLTPRQMAGPFYPNKTKKDEQNDLTHILGRPKKAQGDVIYITGSVQDVDCKPIQYAVVEIWQANKFGRYDHEDDSSPRPHDPNFQYWGRAVTDPNGRYHFKTIAPGPYTGRTPHIHYKVMRRGYRDLITQLYFKGEPLNGSDGIYQSLTAAERRLVTADFTATDPKKGFDEGSKLGVFDITLERV